MRSESGTYLLKRRARGKDDAIKVAFTHAIQLHLATRQFPLPHLIGTRRDNNSMLQWRGAIYEVFEYIKGTGYDSSLDATQDSGKTLGLFHRLLTDFGSEYDPPRGTYHDSRTVVNSLEKCPQKLVQTSAEAAEQREQLSEVVRFLFNAYKQSADAVNQTGLPDWPAQITHSDWHPGNMLFRGSRVVAVIDYDAARLCPRVIDAANGALQFAIVGGNDDASTWPDYLDMARYKRFLFGYDQVNQLTNAELECIPHLMIEALIAEAAIPIAQTGSFARIEGLPFLQMVERKVKWMQHNRNKLTHVLED
jgi:homoserine kinase type II